MAVEVIYLKTYTYLSKPIRYGQDATQGQFFNRRIAGLSYISSRLVA